MDTLVSNLPNLAIAAATIALVVATKQLVTVTKRLAEESALSRGIAEDQARIAEKRFERQRAEAKQQNHMGRSVVAAALQSALRNVEYWNVTGFHNLAARHALPSAIALVPDNSGPAIEYASRLSTDAAAELASAFDNLRLAQTELQILRAGPEQLDDYERRFHLIHALLKSAETDLKAAQEYLQNAVVENEERAMS
jgi:hypothetical protein